MTEYVVEVLVDAGRGWEELYRVADRAEAQRFWEGLLETQPSKPARLIELQLVDVLRTFDPAAAAT